MISYAILDKISLSLYYMLYWIKLVSHDINDIICYIRQN